MNKSYRILLLCGWLLSAAACSDPEVDETADLTLDKTTLSANKRGLTYEGGNVSFEIRSNVYWIIEIDETADWLTVSPRAAAGDRTVTVSVDANAGAVRSAVLHIESYDGTTAAVEITQAGADELIRYAETDFGETTGDAIAVGDCDALRWTGIGAGAIRAGGTGCWIDRPASASDHAEASGGSAVRFGAATQDGPAALVVGPVDTKGDEEFVCRFGIWNSAGPVDGQRLSLQISNDGDEFVDLPFDTRTDAAWTEAVAKFRIAEPDLMYLRIAAPEDYWIDDLHIREGNAGEGEEVIFTVGGDDGREFGYVYFEDDFSWVTDQYKGADYIAGWPSSSSETYWNNVTAAAYGQEAYDALVASGWTTDDNRLKERVYLRIGYVKMGRAANAGGSGGGLVSPALPIKKNCAATVKVSFDCCNFFTTGGAWDPTTTMQVRIIGDGTIDDSGAGERIFQMSATSAVEAIWRSGLPDKNPWERKEFIVRGATASTQVVFESVAETTANRWFFDNVRFEKVKPDTHVDAEPIPLETPVPQADETAATATSILFRWNAVDRAAAYEYVYVCSYCGEEVASRSGVTADTRVEFTSLEPGTACRLRLRALPADGDTNYGESEWSADAAGQTLQPATDTADSHPEGYELFADDFSWVTYALFAQADFVGTYPDNPAGVSFANARKLSTAAADALAASGWTEIAKAYLYEGCLKLGTASAVGSVSSPAMTAIDAGTKVNATVSIGATAFLGTNDVRDDDAAALSIEGDGTFADGTKTYEWRIGAWNDWVTFDIPVLGISASTKFVLATRTAAKGRAFFNLFRVTKLADDYDPAAAARPLETPQQPAIVATTAYGVDLDWPAVAGATDYTYAVVRPDGRIVAEGKTWEPHVHIGGLDGKTVDKHAYYNIRLRANYCNYDASKVEVPADAVPSSGWSTALKAVPAVSTATVYADDDFSWTLPEASDSPLLKSGTDWINTYCTTDKMNRFDTIVKEGITTLNGWDYDAANKSVYTRPGYIHINSSSALGTLVSPALTGIEGTRDVEVSFDATYFYQYFSKTADTGRTLQVTLAGSGTIEGAADGVLTLTLARGNAWEGFTFRIAGADASTQIRFTPGAAAKNRVQFDNFRVVAIE